MPRFSPRRSACALAALAISGLGALAASPAQAESFEQITRLNGAQGASPFYTFGQPEFTSDSGRWAIASVRPYSLTPSYGVQALWVRDIVANTTRPLGDPTVSSIWGVDNAEQHALVTRFDHVANKTSLALAPIAGGPVRVLRTWNGQLGNITAALSGDGKTVAVSDPNDAQIPGLFTITVATGAIKQIDTARVDLGPRRISDDGKVITGRLVGSLQGVYYRGTTKTVTPADTVVSPNGAVVAGITNQSPSLPSQIITRTLASNVTKTFALPADVHDLAWISPDGRYLATAANRETTPEIPTRILDITTGTWTDLAGDYGTSIAESLVGHQFGAQFPAVSRSGRYATVPYRDFLQSQFALVDLTGADLPGAQEALSASSYIGLSQPYRSCPGEPSELGVTFTQSRTWVPRPQSATIRVTADGLEIYNETLTEPGTAENQTAGYVGVEYPATTESLDVTVSVVDAAGRTVTGSATAKPSGPFGCNQY